MNPSPASVAALVLVAAALSLIVLLATAGSPRVDRVPQIERDPVEKAERPAQRSNGARRSPGPPRSRHGRRAGHGRRSRHGRRPRPGPATPPATVGVDPVATPEEAALAPAAAQPASVVTAYYRALDARSFDGAWETLAPEVRTAFGGFEKWRTGYATTVASRPQGIAVERDGSVATVAHELVTETARPAGRCAGTSPSAGGSCSARRAGVRRA